VLPVPVMVSAWLAVAAPLVPAVSVQVGLAAVSAAVQPENARSAGAAAAETATLSALPNEPAGVSVTVNVAS
jgi:hypothetical protein